MAEAGRLSSATHPAKVAKLESQRLLQSISRREEVEKAHKNHNDLMNTFAENIGQICKQLKQIRGETDQKFELPFIVTMNEIYTSEDVLEGFCSNTEALSTDVSDNEHEFFNMCV